MYIHVIYLLSWAAFSHLLQEAVHCSFYVLKVLQAVEFVEKIAKFFVHIVAVVVGYFAEQE